MADYLYRRCGCEHDGKQYPVLRDNASPDQLAKACPKMATDPTHGGWGFYLSAGRDPKTNKRRQIRRTGYRTKREAQAAYRSEGKKADDGVYVPPTRQTYGEYIDQWFQHRLTTGDGFRPTTEDNYARYIASDIKPSALGRMKLTDIRKYHVNGFVSELTAQGRGATTVRRIAAVVQGSLKAAWQDELIDHNPGAGIRLPSVQKQSFEPWEPEQLGTFLDVAVAHRLGALFEVLAYTGMRRGEALGLRWSDVNFERGTLTIRNNRTSTGSRIVEGAPKTDAGRRTISYPDQVGGVLLAWQLRQREEAETLEGAWTDSGYVFTYPTGEPLKPQYVTRLFEKLRAQSGLPRMPLHGLRHESASLLLSHGADIALVSKMLGHSSVSITADLYSHLIARADRDASAKVAAAVPRASAHRVHTEQH
ncbi:tyrosine-type recombinase/integrase [Leifsonia poae]|uniref:tyrosine-type recombinase/integrase n=1 Tax=Leifsonia poae TaxID=110933 RepID=UPI003D6977B1